MALSQKEKSVAYSHVEKIAEKEIVDRKAKQLNTEKSYSIINTLFSLVHKK